MGKGLVTIANQVGCDFLPAEDLGLSRWHANKIVEVKCPFGTWSTSLRELASSWKGYFLKGNDGHMVLDVSHKDHFLPVPVDCGVKS